MTTIEITRRVCYKGGLTLSVGETFVAVPSEHADLVGAGWTIDHPTVPGARAHVPATKTRVVETQRYIRHRDGLVWFALPDVLRPWEADGNG